jgi:hypothetical protein
MLTETQKQRQVWLSKFLSFIDTKAPALQYRRELGITFAALPAHVRSIESYRNELADLNRAAAPTSQLPIPTAKEIFEIKEKRIKENKNGKEKSSS